MTRHTTWHRARCWSEYMSLGEAAIFEYAFKLGARIALEILSE